MDAATTPTTWTVTARNLLEHADNPIHTDAGAHAAGFPSALVAGVTTYAYLTRPIVAAWGTDWLARGGAEVRFRAPVFAQRTVDCVPTPDSDGSVTVAAIDPLDDINPRAVLRAIPDVGPARPRREGAALPPLQVTLDGEFGADYGRRAGDDLELYERDGIVHPAVWPALANRMYTLHLVDGSWIHTRSIVRHHRIVPSGAEVVVHATVVERFERRALTDIDIELDGEPVVTIEHEAIVDLDDG